MVERVENTTWTYNGGEAKTFTVTGTADPTAGGTITVNGTANSAQVTENTKARLVATEKPGYTFSHWSGGDITDITSSRATNPTYTVSRVNSDMDFVAHFTAIPTYTVSGTASPSGGGTISVNGGGASATVTDGESATLVVTTNAGYKFTGWTGGDITGTDTSTTHTVDNVTSNLSFTANFVPIYNVSYDTNGGTGNPAGETGILDTDSFTLPASNSVSLTGSTFA